MRISAAESGKTYGFSADDKNMIIYGSHDIFYFRKDRAETGYDHVSVFVVRKRFTGCKRTFDTCAERCVDCPVGIDLAVTDDENVGYGTQVHGMDKAYRKFRAVRRGKAAVYFACFGVVQLQAPRTQEKDKHKCGTQQSRSRNRFGSYGCDGGLFMKTGAYSITPISLKYFSAPG